MTVDLTQFKFTVRPETPFNIPYSDGYILYSAILNRVQDADEDASEALHSEHGRIHVSGLQGDFHHIDQHGHHRMTTGEYTFTVGLATTDTTQADALLEALAFDVGTLTVGDGTLNVTAVESNSTSTTALLEQATEYTQPDIHIDFVSPTCIRAGKHGSTEMFPHRTAVFESLRGSWNHIAPADEQLTFTGDGISEYMYELPEYSSLDSHNVVVNMVGEGADRHPIKRHGFTGQCTYRLQSETSAAVQNAAVTLANAGEYLGVGSAVSRGCGTVDVSVSNR